MKTKKIVVAILLTALLTSCKEESAVIKFEQTDTFKTLSEVKLPKPNQDELTLDSEFVDSTLEVLEKMTKNVHLSYSPQDTELKEFYKKNYNIKSSRAFALHIKYKIYSILKEKYTGKEEIDKKLFEQYIKEEAIMNKLIINEHNRWMAYMRSIGFKKATIEDVQKYKTQTNHHVNFLGKLHPALVEYDQLKEVEQKIGVPLQSKDRMILCNIGKIMKE